LVWSPDGKQLLLTEIKGDGPDLDVVLIDLESGRASSKSQNSFSVFGWVRTKEIDSSSKAVKKNESSARRVTAKGNCQ